MTTKATVFSSIREVLEELFVNGYAPLLPEHSTIDNICWLSIDSLSFILEACYDNAYYRAAIILDDDSIFGFADKIMAVRQSSLILTDATITLEQYNSYYESIIRELRINFKNGSVIDVLTEQESLLEGYNIIAYYQNENSPARIRLLEATLSSLSNYTESVLDSDPRILTCRIYSQEKNSECNSKIIREERDGSCYESLDEFLKSFTITSQDGS